MIRFIQFTITQQIQFLPQSMAKLFTNKIKTFKEWCIFNLLHHNRNNKINVIRGKNKKKNITYKW